MKVLRLKEKKLREVHKILVNPNFDKGLIRVFKKHEQFAIDLNKDQLLSGRNNRGGVLGYYKDKVYAFLKRKANPKAQGRVDLLLMGDFQGAMFMRNKMPLTISSKDSKTRMLTNKYAGVFGLNEKNTDRFAERAKPDVIQYIKRKLSLV
jgi:hypothetical protein